MLDHPTQNPDLARRIAAFGSRKLNLGCGTDHRPGYINVDMHAFQQPDIVADVIDLAGFPSAGFDEIIAQDILEHFRWRDTPMALLEWNRLLALGGRIFIRTTYLNGVLRLFEHPELQSVKMQNVILQGLFSNQMVAGDYHMTGFTEILMRFHLWAMGFDIEEISVRGGWLFELWARKTQDLTHSDLIDGVADDDDFMQQVYRRVLQREPDPEGAAGFLARLRSGEMSRADVVRVIVLSDENRERLAANSPTFELAFNQGTT